MCGGRSRRQLKWICSSAFLFVVLPFSHAHIKQPSALIIVWGHAHVGAWEAKKPFHSIVHRRQKNLSWLWVKWEPRQNKGTASQSSDQGASCWVTALPTERRETEGEPGSGERVGKSCEILVRGKQFENQMIGFFKVQVIELSGTGGPSQRQLTWLITPGPTGWSIFHTNRQSHKYIILKWK